MPLEPIDSRVVREDNGFSFIMRVAGTQQTVRVFVSEDALEGESVLADDKEMLAQLDADRSALEALANEKYCRGQVAADGVVAITFVDIAKFIE
jgi:hypothetical protein